MAQAIEFDGDFHMHSKASDGHCSIERLADEAKRKGLKAIAISDHSFTSLFCHQSYAKFAAQCAEIDAVTGIEIYHGIEANIVAEDGTIDVPDDVIPCTRPLTAGFHRFVELMFKRSSRRFLLVNGFLSERERQKLKDVNTEAFLNAIERYPLDIVAHLGHRCPVDMVKIAEACKKRGVYLEFNEKHIADTTGFESDIDRVAATGVNFIVGSDAHSASAVGKFDRVREFIQRHDIPLERIYGINGNMPTFKDKSEWKNEF